jgi:hypothetical protein
MAESGARAAAALRAALIAAVAAAAAGDQAAFAEASRELAGLDATRTGIVQAATIRQLLEVLHPDGLAADDVADLIRQTVAEAAGCYPEVDADAVVAVYLNSLGAADVEENAQPPEQIVVHGCLALATLSRRAAQPPDRNLDDALAELRRAETMELP